MKNFSNKYVYIIVALSFLAGLFNLILFTTLSNETVSLSKIPLVEQDYFNGFINQNNRSVANQIFNPVLMIMSFGCWGSSNWALMTEVVLIPFWIVVAIPVVLIPLIHKKQLNGWIMLTYGVVMIILTINICFQLILFLKPDIYEITLNKHLDIYFGENFLEQKIGAETLSSQISTAAMGLKSLFGIEYKIMAIMTIILGLGVAGAILISFVFYWTWAIRTKRKEKLRRKH
ncbi:hypothetical protein [Spiroplasma alleghenense]|uniref:Uncharacterized protein n=1 Tax=Spiroplasma alleghenense TaxID=216931 RepID=A0A345Z4N3_9MOLU|nr:hypothetical protein [Spiroplasma alleghenense]AXK51562.1 hypothetical protein SALLE_v1c08920 [Spiroplasma alleghenense]